MPFTRKERKDICSVLRRHLGQRTVLAVAVPVLIEHIDAIKRGYPAAGLTEKQIDLAFRKLTSQFIRSDYHSTYISRRLGPRGFLQIVGEKYRIRDPLLVGVKVESLEELRDELIASLRSAYEQRQVVIRKLEEMCSLPKECVEERYDLINAYLRQFTGNRGEMFEVVSFAVLSEYFRTFGFSLQRFSTTHANDGGMDFVAGEAIYQVTTDESVHKLLRDLAKAPGTKRVLVRPSMNSQIMKLCEGDVLETVELRDLLSHFIAWLLARVQRSKPASTLHKVLQ